MTHRGDISLVSFPATDGMGTTVRPALVQADRIVYGSCTAPAE